MKPLKCLVLAVVTVFALSPALSAKSTGEKGSKHPAEQSAPAVLPAAPVPLLDPPPSPTLGAPAPAGAIILFDGKDMNAWVHHKPKQWLVAGEPCTWPIKDGVVTTVANSGSLITTREFGDFKLHAEFMTTVTPTNAGFYLMSRYELKIHETYGNPTPGSCGNFGNCDAGGPPKVNASRPKGEWQTFDVEFRAPRLSAAGKIAEPARATVILSGIKLYDDQPLINLRLAAATLPVASRGPLQLKEHGNVVKFRNIWIVDLDKDKSVAIDPPQK